MTTRKFTPLSGQEILGGLAGRHNKRAATVLFAIESRTAHLVAHAKHALEFFLTGEMVEEHNLAFLDALDRDHQLPFAPTIQDVERYASQWASAAPKSPTIQAAVAHLLSQKYTFTFQSIPEIRRALSLDEDAVHEAYQRQYENSLDTIFTPQIPLGDRLRWKRAGLAKWLEELPPFWTAYALTLTNIVGAGILALPIALARLGPLVGILLLVLLGLVNVVTIALMAEAVARTGSIRYGNSFLGRMVTDYFGRRIASLFSIGVFIYCGLGVLAYYLGFSLTMEDVTHLPAGLWVGCIFLVGVYCVRRQSLDATVVSALLVGAINISVILLLSFLAFRHSQPENVLYVRVPFSHGQPFDATILQCVFGVIMTAYLGHLSVSNCAQVVLRRDPGGRSLLWGAVAAQITSLFLYCTWVLAVNGAIAPEILAAEPGTSLIPLAAEIGPVIKTLGTLFVLLALGMASIHPSLVLLNLMREWLPGPPKIIANLPRRRGQLLFQTDPRIQGGESECRLGLTYLGLTAAQPQFRWDIQLGGRHYHRETVITKAWSLADLLEQFPELNDNALRLALEVSECFPDRVRLQVDSSLRMIYREHWDRFGLSMADIVTLPADQRQIVTWMMRQKDLDSAVSVSEIAAHTGQHAADTCASLATLVSQHFLHEINIAGETHYQIRLAYQKQGRQLSADFSRKLSTSSKALSRKHTGFPFGACTLLHRIRALIGSERGHAIIAISPLVVVFLCAEWLLVSGIGSFTDLLNIRGILITPLLSGILPIVLVYAGRRKGECIPATACRLLSHPFIMVGLYLFFLSSLFLYGLIIWEAPPKRIAALMVGFLVIGLTMVIHHQRGFVSRTVIELRNEQRIGGQTHVTIMTDGKPGPATIDLKYPDKQIRIQAPSTTVPDFAALRHAHVYLPGIKGQELKVWAHTITPERDSESLPVLLTVVYEQETEEYDLRLFGGHIVLPAAADACRLELRCIQISEIVD